MGGNQFNILEANEENILTKNWSTLSKVFRLAIGFENYGTHRWNFQDHFRVSMVFCHVVFKCDEIGYNK